jgi:hypothetical protein
MADHLPAGERCGVERGEARRDDALARLPERVERRQAGKSRLLPHAVEVADHLAPDIELAKNEGVDQHRRRPPELAGVRKRGGEHRVDQDEVGRLGGDDALDFFLDRGRSEIAGGAGEWQPLG